MARVIRERMTKALVLLEVEELRKKIRRITTLNERFLRREYANSFPDISSELIKELHTHDMISSLLIQATFHMTNVLGLE